MSGREVGGYWTPGSNSIVLAGNGVLEGSFVRHEMLHALTRAPKGHKREDFLDKCGGVVSVFLIASPTLDHSRRPTPQSLAFRQTFSTFPRP